MREGRDGSLRVDIRAEQRRVPVMELKGNVHLSPREEATRVPEAARQRRKDDDQGQRGYGVELDQLFPLPLVFELGPRPPRRRQVRARLRDRRREDDSMAPSLPSIFAQVRGHPLLLIRRFTARQNVVTARVRELVDRTLPTFAIPGQRARFF